MSLPAIYFKGLLESLVGQLFAPGQEYAECGGKDFDKPIGEKVLFHLRD